MKVARIQKLAIGLVSLIVLAYMGFQASRYLGSIYQTETVYTQVVSESTKVTGLVLRQEELLEDYVYSGIAAYTVEDGTKVSKGMTIAEVYQNQQDAEAVYEIRSLQSKRALLEEAQDPSTTSYAHPDVLNRQIFSEIGAITDQVHRSDLSNLENASEKLQILMNTKQIALGNQSNFNTTIESIRAEEQYARDRIRTEPRKITISKAGYFIRTIDGFESCIDLENIKNLTPDDLSSAMMRQAKANHARIGKLMTNHNWYFAALIPADEEKLYRVGRGVTLDFGISGAESIDATVIAANKDAERERAVVVFRSDMINPSVVNLRATQAEVRFKSVSGLRVNDLALRFNGLEKGVYIVEGENMAFRKVNVLYEGEGYVICENITSADDERYSESLKLFDEVITEGWHLYDGKPLK